MTNFIIYETRTGEHKYMIEIDMESDLIPEGHSTAMLSLYGKTWQVRRKDEFHKKPKNIVWQCESYEEYMSRFEQSPLKQVMFFDNGNTAIFDGEEQMVDLQKSWLRIFFEYMVDKGYNPEEFDYILPTGLKASPFKTGDGSYGWRIK